MSDASTLKQTSAFARMSLRLKTYLGFGALIAAIAIIAVVAIVTGRIVASDVDAFSEAVEVASEVQVLEREVVEFRGQIRAYFLSGLEEDAALAEETAHAIAEDAQHAIEIAHDPGRKAELEKIRDELAHEIEIFEGFLVQRRALEVIMVDRLEVAGEKMIHDLEELEVQAAAAGNADAVLLTAVAIELALELELEVAIMLARHDSERGEVARERFAELTDALNGI